MRIGVPKEIKDHEYRVAMTPGLASELVRLGHEVRIQTQAGAKIGFSDALYQQAGAKIVGTAAEVYECEMVVKVKEPQASEFPLLRKGQVLFCFLHLAPDPEQLKQLIEKEVVAIAFETVTDARGHLPLLTPMSEVAGRLSIQMGATALQMANGGRGVLLGGVPGVSPAEVTVLGGGVVGTQAARMALGMGAHVTIVERRLARLRELDDLFHGAVRTRYSTPSDIEECVVKADLVVGAVLIPGKQAPKLISEGLVRKMQPGSVLVDVAIDQGGCAETSRPTTFSDPIYKVGEVVHYCVANMPGAVARSSAQALVNAIWYYVVELAQKGYQRALREDKGFMAGLNVCLGNVTNLPVAEDRGYAYVPPEKFL